jgi:hypothetical protein
MQFLQLVELLVHNLVVIIVLVMQLYFVKIEHQILLVEHLLVLHQMLQLV